MLQIKLFEGGSQSVDRIVNEWLSEDVQNNYHIYEVTHSSNPNSVTVLITYDNDKAALLKSSIPNSGGKIV